MPILNIQTESLITLNDFKLTFATQFATQIMHVQRAYRPTLNDVKVTYNINSRYRYDTQDVTSQEELTHRTDQSARHGCVLHSLNGCCSRVVSPGYRGVSHNVGLVRCFLGHYTGMNRKQEVVSVT